MVGVIAVAAMSVIALGQSMWWVAFLVVLLIILSFVFGRFEAGQDEDPPRPVLAAPWRPGCRQPPVRMLSLERRVWVGTTKKSRVSDSNR